MTRIAFACIGYVACEDGDCSVYCGRCAVEMSMINPRVIAERDGLRLVHQMRDEKSWSNVSDLTLERITEDAMGEKRWTYVTSWCLSAISIRYNRDDQEYDIIALKMILDTGPVLKKE